MINCLPSGSAIRPTLNVAGAPTLTSMPHTSTIRVRFAELDPYHHVNHTVYVTYFEVARVEAMEACGVSLMALQAEGWQLVVTELEVRFRQPAVGGDSLSVDCSISEMSGASCRWVQRVRRGDTVLVEGRLRTGVTDATGRPQRMPSELRAALANLVQAS